MTSAVNQRRAPAGGVGGRSAASRGRNKHVRPASDGERFFITAGEAALLAEIPFKFAELPWLGGDMANTAGEFQTLSTLEF